MLEMTNKHYICDTENGRRDVLSHCLQKANRASSPIDFYREREYDQICPLFWYMTTLLKTIFVKKQPFQERIIECDNLFSNQPLILTTILSISQLLLPDRHGTIVRPW